MPSKGSALGEPRVGILSPSYGIWGGGQIYIEKMCNYINRHTPCCIFTAEPERFCCAVRGIPVIVAPVQRALAAFSIVSAMRGERITHVVLNDLACAWLAPLFRLCGFRVIPLLHIPLQVARGGHGRLARGIIRAAVRVGAHRVLSVNPDNMTIAPRKSVFVGNFVSPRFFSSSAEPKSYDLCFVGRFSWEKNLELMLHLVAAARSAGQRDLKLLLVGEGPEGEAIGKRVAELRISDLVTIRGWVKPEQLPAVYHSAKCFVVASHHEGFATTLLESHACGLPALTTDVGYCGTFVRGDGNPTGIVFCADDLDDPCFYRSLFQLVDNHHSYHKNCVSKAEQFLEERVLQKIYGEIRDTAARGR